MPGAEINQRKICMILGLAAASVVAIAWSNVMEERSPVPFNRAGGGTGLRVSPQQADLFFAGGEVQRLDLRIENHNAAAREIESIDSTCGCTVPHLQSRLVIPAMSAAVVPVRVTLPRHGMKSVRVSVIEYEGDTHVVELRLIGERTPPPFLVNPPSTVVLTGERRPGVAELTFTVTSRESSSARAPFPRRHTLWPAQNDRRGGRAQGPPAAMALRNTRPRKPPGPVEMDSEYCYDHAARGTVRGTVRFRCRVVMTSSDVVS